MLPGEAKCGKDGDMPHGNGHISHNMHARDLVYTSQYCHCQCESIDMQVRLKKNFNLIYLWKYNLSNQQQAL